MFKESCNLFLQEHVLVNPLNASVSLIRATLAFNELEAVHMEVSWPG